MSEKINAKSVYEFPEGYEGAEGVEMLEYDAGTPVIEVGGKIYDILSISEAMLQTDEERGFPASLCLTAMGYLAKYTSKVAIKTEATAKRQAEEESRLKKQAEFVDPLLSGLSPILSEMAVCDPALITSARIWVSFREGELSFTFPLAKNTELTPEVLASIAEGINANGIGFKATDEVDEGITYSPSAEKATGTRAKGTAVLINGLHRLTEGKALEGFTGGFVVHNGRIHVQGHGKGLFVYESGKDFLNDYTTEEGSKDNPDRPWGFPSKVIASVSSYVGEDTVMYKAFLKWLETKATTTSETPEEAEGVEADKSPLDGAEGQDGAEGDLELIDRAINPPPSLDGGNNETEEEPF